jgi:hypothetical protein
VRKPVVGLIVGGFLGIFDGLSGLITAPEVAPQIIGIVLGSTIKGLISGVLIGLFARKVKSFPLGVAFGLLVGLALAGVVVWLQAASGKAYYWQILLPGALLGAIVGYVTQRYPTDPVLARTKV